MHFFMKFLGIFANFYFYGFLLKIGFLINSEPWVFVHASFKHVSHTLISKFLCLIEILKLGFLVLEKLGIL